MSDSSYHHIMVGRQQNNPFCIPEEACSEVSANSNLTSLLPTGLVCVGLPLGEALLGGELPVDDILIVRLLI